MSCAGTCSETKYEVIPDPPSPLPKSLKVGELSKVFTKNKPPTVLKPTDVPLPSADVDKQAKKGVDAWIKKNLAEAKCDNDCTCELAAATFVSVWTGDVEIPVDWIEDQMGGEVTYTVVVKVNMVKKRKTGECRPYGIQERIKLGKG